MFVESLESRRLLSGNPVGLPSHPPEVTRPVSTPPASPPPTISLPIDIELPSQANH
jgi:hypothetical protein